MKYPLRSAAMIGILCAGIAVAGAADAREPGGPRGGKLLKGTEPLAEFYVEKDHTVTVAFYDAALKPVAAGDMSVRVIAEAPGGKVTLEFEKKGDILASRSKLPEGDGYNLVVQVRPAADAKPTNFRFTFDDHVCGGCGHAEYACTCGH